MRKEKIIICSCGCGEKLNAYDSRNRIRKSLPNHFWKNKPIKNRFKKGMTPWNKGKECPQISIALKGKNLGHSAWNKGKTRKDDPRIAQPWLGKPRYDQRGKNSNLWKGENHKTERRKAMETLEYKNWRRSVFERDDYTCMWCNAKGNEGAYLQADHIKPWVKYPELRYEINNGRTLCRECHKKTDSYGNRYKSL